MFSTRKGGGKASKVARPSKAAETTRARKSSVKGAASSDVDHPPVIVTDGSAAVHLDDEVYERDGDTHTSPDEPLRLISVGANRLHSETKRPECHALEEGERVRIVVTTSLGGGPQRQITITGGNSADPADTPVIHFDHGTGGFPPGNIVGRRRVFRHPNRVIDSLEIFSPPDSDEPVHTCSVVEEQEHYEISFFDDHV